MAFADITIVPVASSSKQAYLAFVKRIAEVYRGYGALRVSACWQSEDASDGADFHAADAMANYEPSSLPNFRTLAGAVEGQTVVVSVIEWPSREVRDLGVKAVAVDPRIQATVDEDPVFDGRQLIAGGFTVELDLR